MTFSVIIPTFKRPDLLVNAVNSVSAQTFSDYEIIVVNDHPGDKEIIDNLLKNFDRTTVYHHTIQEGGNAARNLGIRMSTGDILAFLDDDDVWLPDKLLRHAEAHQQNPKAGLIYSNCLYVHNNLLIADQATASKVPSDIIGHMCKAKFCPTTSSIVTIRKEVVAICGMFDETMVSLQDWDYWFRIAHHFEFAHIPKTLVHFRQHLGDRVSQNETKRLLGIQQICDKWGDQINIPRFTKSMNRVLYYQLSLNALMSGQRELFMIKSLQMLNNKNLSFESVKSFFNLWLHLFFKNRKRRLQFKVLILFLFNSFTSSCLI
ncbi:MAG: glycosyltransferase family A protein [Ginsengibacter sp.]